MAVKLDMQKAITAVAVGVVDEVAEEFDHRNGKTESFQRATDWVRAGAVALGYGIMVFFPKWSKWGEGIAYPATALLVKSIGAPIREGMRSTSTTKQSPATQRFTGSGKVADYATPSSRPAYRGIE